jgi:DNA-binding NarL/FixJ family response regulator
MLKNLVNTLTQRPLRVVVADDDPIYAELLALLVGEDPRLQVVGRASNGAEAVELALRLQPDVVVLDVQMPVLDGVAAAESIAAKLPRTRVVLVSGAEDPDLLDRAARTSDAFVRKGGSGAALVDVLAGREPAARAVALRPAFRAA